MDIDMVLLWSEGEMGHSLELLKSNLWSQANKLNIFHDRLGQNDHDV